MGYNSNRLYKNSDYNKASRGKEENIELKKLLTFLKNYVIIFLES